MQEVFEKIIEKLEEIRIKKKGKIVRHRRQSKSSSRKQRSTIMGEFSAVAE